MCSSLTSIGLLETALEDLKKSSDDISNMKKRGATIPQFELNDVRKSVDRHITCLSGEIRDRIRKLKDDEKEL